MYIKTVTRLLLFIVVGMALFSSLIAMDEYEKAKSQAQQELKRLLHASYNVDKHPEIRGEAALFINNILFSGKIDRKDKVPGKDYTFGTLIDDVANRYRLTKEGNVYKVYAISQSRPRIK